MGDNEKRKGVLPQIIVAVVVALLAGSTSPWWWGEIKEIFRGGQRDREQFKGDGGQIPKPPPVSKPLPVPKPPRGGDQLGVVGGKIQVRCTANPHSIPAGEQVEIRILSFTEKGALVSGANVRIESGGGWFSASGTTTEIGKTDSAGVFTTKWRSPKPAAKGYGMDVTVSKGGFTEGRGECNVPIQ